MGVFAGCFNTSSFAGLVVEAGCGVISFAGLIMFFGSFLVGGLVVVGLVLTWSWL